MGDALSKMEQVQCINNALRKLKFGSAKEEAEANKKEIARKARAAKKAEDEARLAPGEFLVEGNDFSDKGSHHHLMPEVPLLKR